MKAENNPRSRWYRITVASLFGFGLAMMPSLSHAVPLAYNEAVSGDISGEFQDPVFNFDIGSNTISGNMDYTKRLHLFSWARCNVEVYLLHTLLQHLHWPEKESRRTMWVEPGKAASMVRESQLARVLRGFDSSAISL